jgi:hypothetical protein
VGSDQPHIQSMEKLFPAHHRKRMDRMLKAAKADLIGRGIDPSKKTALEIFASRATERGKDRFHSLAEKASRVDKPLKRPRVTRSEPQPVLG